jgi:hypothetical protein
MFEDPVALEAGGKVIDVNTGHAAPWVADVDGDGVRDLLVGQFGGGKVLFFKNSGTDEKPKLEKGVFVKAGGVDATVPYG